MIALPRKAMAGSGDETQYLSSQPGLRRFFLASVTACSLGLWFRMAVSSDRLREWIDPALDRAPYPINEATFASAAVVLSHGIWPALAVRLTDLEVPAPEECGPDRFAARASEIEVPLRLGPLLTRGEAAAGLISFSDLDVDLDAWRPGCGRLPAPAAKESARPSVARLEPKAASSASAIARSRAGDSTLSDDDGEPGAPPEKGEPWWRPEDLANARRIALGARAVRARLRFEGGAKAIEFDSLEARAGKRALLARLKARVPAELTYGEALPPIVLEGEATADGAQLVGEAGIDEGRIRVVASLRPTSDGGVWIEARASAKGVPASALEPLARRAAGAPIAFRPRFTWLECAASIQGKVQGLFESAPLRFRRCALDGEAGRVSIGDVSRLPNGGLSPFLARIEGADARAWASAFGFEGPSGVFSDFGKIDGEIRHFGGGDFSAKAKLSGARAVFVNREARAHQGLALEASMEKRGAVARGRLDSAALDGGGFDGSATWEFDSAKGAGLVDVQARALAFAPDVQRVMLDGSLRSLSGSARIELAAPRRSAADASGERPNSFLRRAVVEAAFAGLDSAHVRAETAAIRGEFVDGLLRATAKAPRAELPTDGAALSAVRPLFLGHRFGRSWLEFTDFSARLALSEASFGWEGAQAKLEGGRIALSSSGNVDRDRRVAGAIQADFPKAKRARFALSGVAHAPTLEPISELAKAAALTPPTDAALGL